MNELIRTLVGPFVAHPARLLRVAALITAYTIAINLVMDMWVYVEVSGGAGPRLVWNNFFGRLFSLAFYPSILLGLAALIDRKGGTK